MNILITGGAGFIGGHTADALLAKGHKVRVLDYLDPQVHGESGKFPAYLHADVECMQGDVRNAEDVGRALQGIDAVYHFAALTGVGQSMYDLRSYVDTNCTGTATLLEVIVKQHVPLKKLVLASSRAIYGEGTHSCQTHGMIYPKPRFRADMENGNFGVYCPQCGTKMVAVATREDHPSMPLSVYAWTKEKQEDLCRYAAKTFGVPVVGLRYFNVYGSRQSLKNPYTGVVSIFYSRLMAGQPIFLYEHGEPRRDFVHVSDVVRANLLALEAQVESGACFNVGTGVEHTILDVAHALAHACGRTPEILDRGEFRAGDIYSCYADLQQAETHLGYVPRVSLEVGMKEFAEWAAGQASVDLYQKTVDELERHGLFGQATGKENASN